MAPARWLLALLLIVVALAAAGLLFGPSLAPLARDGVRRLADAGFAGALAFIVAFVVASLLFVPGTLLGLAGGAAYGVLVGSALTLVGATLGAMAAFLVARRWARRPVAAWVERHPRLQALDGAFRSEGLRTAFLLRLSPLVPFNVLNYALGATAVRARDAALACVAMLPGTVLYAAAGRAAAEASGVAGREGAERTPAGWALLIVGIVATALATILLARAARRSLDRAVATAAPPAPAEPTGPSS